MLSSLIYFIRKLFKKPLKIGLISYYYPKDSNINNGVAIHTYYLSRKLAELGCEVHVFTRGEKITTKKKYLGYGKLVVHWIDTKFNCPVEDVVTKKRMSYFIFDNKIINEMMKENSREEFDIIHTHGWLTAGAFISKHFNDLKWIHTFHALEKNRLKFMSKEEKKYFKIARWIESTVKYSDALVAVSQNLKKEVLQNYPVRKEKVFYIPNGVDLDVFKSENNLTEEKSVLYIGRFSLEKGIDLIPKIARYILERNPKIKFVVLAPGSIPPSMEKIKEEFDVLSERYPEKFTLYRETLDRKKLVQLYQNSLIYIQPSRYEAFGLCVLEAMACGKAVICSNKGGLPEVVKNAGVVLPLSVKRFSISILRLLKDYRLRERYVRRAVRRARIFSWDRVAKETLALYRKISGRIGWEIKIRKMPEVKIFEF